MVVATWRTPLPGALAAKCHRQVSFLHHVVPPACAHPGCPSWARRRPSWDQVTGASQASVLILGRDWTAPSSSPCPHLSVGYVSKCERICLSLELSPLKRLWSSCLGSQAGRGAGAGCSTRGGRGPSPCSWGCTAWVSRYLHVSLPLLSFSLCFTQIECPRSSTLVHIYQYGNLSHPRWRKGFCFGCPCLG